MSDHYYAQISMPTKFMNPEILDKFQEEGLQYENEDQGIIVYGSDSARNGEFPELEEYLTDLGVPFDRYSSGYYEYPPQRLYNRPDQSIHREVVLSPDDNEYIPIDSIKELVNVIMDEEKGREDALEAVNKLMAEHGSLGIKPIEDYA